MIYAINKRTKEHRVCEDGVTLDGIGWRFVEADADGWIPWEGGECPLPDGADYEVRHKYGKVVSKREAEKYNDQWARKGLLSDIIAYRPILDAGAPAEPEAPEWDGDGECPPVGSKCMRGCDRVVILAHTNVGSPYDPAVVYQSLTEPDEIDWDVCNVFSPIRTAAQRAEDEAFEQAMRDVDPEPDEHRPHVESVVYRMIRAGYRKTKGDKS